jgi:diguanylate cyclase (GGDEF)-like protein
MLVTDPMTSDRALQHNSAQQLLRYSALFKLMDDIAGLDDLSLIATLVDAQWHQFARLAGWRLVLVSGASFHVLDGHKGQTSVSETPALSAWDAQHWRLDGPRLLDGQRSEALAQLPEVLRGPAGSEVLVVPFERAGQTFGLLSAAAMDAPFSQLEQQFIQLCGRQLSNQVSGLLLREKAKRGLREHASHDAMTQLLTRSAIVQELEGRLALSQRTGQALGLILLDMDFFKPVSAQYGQPTGDEILCEVATRLQGQTRAGDSLGHYGGAGFLVLLYPCDEPEVAVVAERLRLAIEEKPALLGGCSADTIDLTISLGTTCCSGQDNMRVEKLLKQADEALNQSKAQGRNRASPFATITSASSPARPVG